MRTKSVAGLTGLFFLLPCLFRGQAPAKLEFEVASVRAADPLSQTADIVALARNSATVSGGPGTADPERLTIRRVPLRRLLYTAFAVRPDQISGPDWLDSEVFDIAAKIAAGTTKEQANAMLQNLLIERFKITFHLTTRDLPGYELTVAKNGAKLKEVPEAAPSPDATSPKPEKRFQVDLDAKGFPIIPEGRSGIVAMRNKDGLNRMTCHACSIAELISRITVDLAVPMGSPVSPYAMAGRVVDKTELNGKYDFHLEYSGGLVGAALQPLSVDDQAVSGPDLFTALEKQLGLRLEKTKVPLDVLVIDHADRVPTEN